MHTKVTILGGGAMATACAVVLAEQPEQEISIWARNPAYAEQMQHDRENRRLLPGIRIPDRVQVTSDIDQARPLYDYEPSRFDAFFETQCNLRQIPAAAISKEVCVSSSCMSILKEG